MTRDHSGDDRRGRRPTGKPPGKPAGKPAGQHGDRAVRRDDRQRRPAGERAAGDRPSAPPEIPDDVRADELDRAVRDELRSLAKPVAETVARHLVAAGRLIEDDAPTALTHAAAARRLASRVAAVREAVGVTAYHAGDWQTAISELRTYHRMSGLESHLPLLADCERALGRPERAVEIYRSSRRERLTPATAVELLIVAASARVDLGQVDAALAMLQVPQLQEEGPGTPRLRYAYAEALAAAGRPQEARDWFARTVDVDADGMTGAAERLLELDGVTVEEAAEEAPEPAGVAERPAESAGEPSPTGSAATEPPPGTAAQPARGSGRLVDAYDLVVLDLDGVVYLGDQAVAGAAEVVAQLRRDGPPLLFATNNASRNPRQVAELLSGLGVAARPEEVLTSASAAADHLAALLPPAAPVLVVGAPALREQVRQAGLQPVGGAAGDPAAVVQGYGIEVGWPELAEACVAIRAGAHWVATNTDATLPSARGPLPGNGALVAALRTALGREPDLVVGKPRPTLFRTAAAQVSARHPLVVGDRLDTDIDAARAAGMDSLLVLTGVDGEAEVAGRPGHRRPTHVAADLRALLAPAGRR